MTELRLYVASLVSEESGAAGVMQFNRKFLLLRAA